MKKIRTKEEIEHYLCGIGIDSNNRWIKFCELVENGLLSKEAFNAGLNIAYTDGHPNWMAQEYFLRADKSLLMSKEENEFYNNLPDEVTLYRGASETEIDEEGGRDFGLSWTTERKVAEFFAFGGMRFNAEDGMVIKSPVWKEDIKAIFLDRGEYEAVVVDSDDFQWDI